MDRNEILSKLPPQALELEEVVLGALMLERDAIISVIDILTDETFYKAEHKAIFKSIMDLHNKSQSIDLLTVMENLKLRGALQNAGGAFYLTEITSRISGSANISFHAAILKQKELQRKLIDIGNNISSQSYSDLSDPLELIEKTSNKLYELLSGTLGRDFATMETLLPERLKNYEKPLVNGLTGISTGLNELDEITNGWQNGNLIILAARPSMGKTALALNFLRNAALNEKLPVAIFSLEMSKEQLIDRIISSECEIELEALKKRNLRPDQWHKLNSKSNNIYESQIIVDESSSLTINQVKAKAVRLKQKHNIGLIIIDYLQLLSGTKGKGNREQEISEISRGLKHIAKDLSIPVIALSQLSRAVESRTGGSKKPMLSDLRESGSIEQDADVVMFLYRPEYYGICEDENGNPTSGVAEIIIAKNRDGVVDTARCNFVGKYQQFKDEENESFVFKDYQEITNEPNNSLSPSEQW